MLDLTQMTLDITGIVDPTPVSDGTNAAISLARGDVSGAAISAIGLLPVLGDLAKLGKLKRWSNAIDRTVALAKADPAFRRNIWPKLKKLDGLLGRMPLDKLPASVGRQIERIRDQIHSLRPKMPHPNSYLSKEALAAHKAHFSDGVARIQSWAPDGKIGPPTGGVFVMAKKDAEAMIKQSKGNPRELEKLLGLKPGALGEGPVLVDIPNPKGLRMPTGNEAGANRFWIPGGKTSGGVPEAVIDRIPKGSYSVTPIKPGGAP